MRIRNAGNEKNGHKQNYGIKQQTQYVIWNFEDFAVFACKHDVAIASHRTEGLLRYDSFAGKIYRFADSDCREQQQ